MNAERVYKDEHTRTLLYKYYWEDYLVNSGEKTINKLHFSRIEWTAFNSNLCPIQLIYCTSISFVIVTCTTGQRTRIKDDILRMEAFRWH
uniref:Neur_chan_LBD domain-containing protein n=1 Tax=Steinernema glaseri TaxID=37863 RepID=A0A1I8APH4_9BILA